MNWELISAKKERNGELPVITKKFRGHVDNSKYPLISVDIDLTLTMPADATAPVPIIIELSLSPEVFAALAKRFPGDGLLGLRADVAAASSGQGMGLCHLYPNQRPTRQRRRAHGRSDRAC